MKKINFLKYLLSDAVQELEYIETYHKAVEAAEKDNAKYEKLWKMRSPSRQRIRDDFKMIRRISLEIEKGL